MAFDRVKWHSRSDQITIVEHSHDQTCIRGLGSVLAENSSIISRMTL